MLNSGIVGNKSLFNRTYFRREIQSSIKLIQHARNALAVQLRVFKHLSSTYTPNPTINDFAVTFEMSGGRFGDQINSFLHALWISHKYGIPILLNKREFEPDDTGRIGKFDFADQLGIEEMCNGMLTQDILKKYTRLRASKKLLDQMSSKVRKRKDPLFKRELLKVQYFPEGPVERLSDTGADGRGYNRSLCHHDGLYFEADWYNPSFKKKVIKCLEPKTPIQEAPFPKGKTIVGAHVRMGSGVDADTTKYYYPLKIPPITFYVDQIQRVIQEHPRDANPLYFHIFTDHADPKAVIHLLKEHLRTRGLDMDHMGVEFGYTANSSHTNPLRDFFSMSKCHTLIRSDSHLSLYAGILGRIQGVIQKEIAPRKYTLVDLQGISFDQFEEINGHDGSKRIFPCNYWIPFLNAEDQAEITQWHKDRMGPK